MQYKHRRGALVQLDASRGDGIFLAGTMYSHFLELLHMQAVIYRWTFDVGINSQIQNHKPLYHVPYADSIDGTIYDNIQQIP